MKADDFEGNPQVNCDDVDYETLSNLPSIPQGLPVAHASAPGIALFGPTYFNLWVQLIGIRESSPLDTGPFFQLGPIYVRLIRQRYYYFSEPLMKKSLKQPVSLNLMFPKVPFFEISSEVTDGSTEESIQGLQYFERSRFEKDGIDFFRQMARLLNLLKKRGRPAFFSNREDYDAALRDAKRLLEASAQRFTQDSVAELWETDPRMIREWNKQFGVQWRNFMKNKSGGN